MDVLRNGELYLFGAVGSDLMEFGIEGFTAMDVVNALTNLGRKKRAIVHLNSGGGFTDEGLAIFSLLDAHPGGVDVIVESVAASAASLVAMAGQSIVMRPGSTMMIHDPSGVTLGTSKDHKKAIESLEATANSMADIYSLRNKNGKTSRQTRIEMEEETWLTAQEAVDEGYADRVERARGSAKNPTAFDYRIYKHAPERLVALARQNDWTIEGAKPSAKKEKSMAKENDKTEAEMAEFNAAVAAEVTKQIAKKDADAKTAKDAADAEAARLTAEAEKKTAAPDAVASETQRAADIVAACNLVGKPEKAVDFIAKKTALSDVVKALQGDRVTNTQETSNHNGRQLSEDEKKNVSTSWKKVTDRVNARLA